jgi:hypothetical protein
MYSNVRSFFLIARVDVDVVIKDKIMLYAGDFELNFSLHILALSTMSWPAHVVAKSSRLLDTVTIEDTFYGLYNNIRYEYFPPSQFTVAPRSTTAEAQTSGTGAINFAINKKINFVITYVVELAVEP